MIIAVVNNKGGIGKTSTATFLTQLALREKGKTVVAVDVCGQQNFSDNLESDGSSGFDVEVIHSADRTPDESALRKFDYAIIDTPPTTQTSVMRKIIEFSDAIVIPFLLQKHAIYGLDEVLGIVPEDKEVFLVCIMPKKLPEYEAQLLSLVDKNFGRDYFRVPLLARINKNFALKRPFDYGLKKDEKDAFLKVFKTIKKEVNAK